MLCVHADINNNVLKVAVVNVSSPEGANELLNCVLHCDSSSWWQSVWYWGSDWTPQLCTTILCLQLVEILLWQCKGYSQHHSTVSSSCGSCLVSNISEPLNWSDLGGYNVTSYIEKLTVILFRLCNELSLLFFPTDPPTNNAMLPGIITFVFLPNILSPAWVNYRWQGYLQMTFALNANQTRILWLPNSVVNVTCSRGRQFVSVASHVCDEAYQEGDYTVLLLSFRSMCTVSLPAWDHQKCCTYHTIFHASTKVRDSW